MDEASHGVCQDAVVWKTVVGGLARGQRVIYTTPLKVGAVFGKGGSMQGGCSMIVAELEGESIPLPGASMGTTWIRG